MEPNDKDCDSESSRDRTSCDIVVTSRIEGNSNCRFCRESRPHPRLARGETYPCGYKPYRCEVCGYSTTTKGNLTIHLQSDKHQNNLRVLTGTGENNYDQKSSDRQVLLSWHLFNQNIHHAGSCILTQIRGFLEFSHWKRTSKL